MIRKMLKRCLQRYLRPTLFCQIQSKEEIMITINKRSHLLMKQREAQIMVLNINGKIQNLILVLTILKMVQVLPKMNLKTCSNHLKEFRRHLHLNFQFSQMTALTDPLASLLFKWHNKYLRKFLAK